MLIPHYYSVARLLLPVIHDLTSRNQPIECFMFIFVQDYTDIAFPDINQDAIITLTQDNQSYF